MNINVSIIVPCYNQSQFLDEALASVYHQTAKDWECIIVDDGSKDQTKEVAKRWCDKDSRFLYIYQENAGLSATRNTGINRAKGIYVLPLDADDKIADNYIALALSTFKKDEAIKVVYAKAEKFGSVSEKWNLKDFSLKNLSRNNMIFCSALFRKSDWERIGGYDENMLYGWEDWELWIAMLKNGGKVVKLDNTCFFYRIKESSMLTGIDKNKADYLLNYLNVKHADFFVKHYGTFQDLDREIILLQETHKEQMDSEKYVIDVFFSKFLGFSIFGKYKKNRN
ncbi:glycosyltransferase family A protein [Lacinutrix sp. Bg11-31]|uniref:glycosyltransferase family 2 protein n=1 Tax=Lacinutrix sp. Bg11-31 TaxID=2057808 RepID=UPI000C30A87D|nr:glycosyltransferase family A protein [Lacinutrix sp. Bg11-31]AUC82082.1 glycosyl transferase family 2 [Lacinutrix sp. Bg11-31]